jgi:hypothetical protein
MRRIIAIAGIAAFALTAGAIPASAVFSPQFSSTPESGPPGTVIHAFSGGDDSCDQAGIDVVVTFGRFDTAPTATVHTTAKNDAGDWSVDITVPNDSAPGEYVVNARCATFEVVYASNPFTVTKAVATTTTSTTVLATAGSSTTTTTVPPAPVPVAVAAAPVVASPALTG